MGLGSGSKMGSGWECWVLGWDSGSREPKVIDGLWASLLWWAADSNSEAAEFGTSFHGKTEDW